MFDIIHIYQILILLTLDRLDLFKGRVVLDTPAPLVHTWNSQAKNSELCQAVVFERWQCKGLNFPAHRMLEYGEAHFESLLAGLKDTWADLPAVSSNSPFPLNFSAEEHDNTKRDLDNAVKERLHDLMAR